MVDSAKQDALRTFMKDVWKLGRENSVINTDEMIGKLIYRRPSKQKDTKYSFETASSETPVLKYHIHGGEIQLNLWWDPSKEEVTFPSTARSEGCQRSFAHGAIFNLTAIIAEATENMCGRQEPENAFKSAIVFRSEDLEYSNLRAKYIEKDKSILIYHICDEDMPSGPMTGFMSGM